jgi:phage protein U
MSFEKPTAWLSIASLDDGTTVNAQFNPKELQIDKSVPWQKHNKANANGLQLEFTGAEGREMTLELFFDSFEKPALGRPGPDVKGQVALLEKLASVRDPDSTDDAKRRPHHCVVAWGDAGIPKFQCVIESLSTKYSMFKSDGTPVRCTVSIKLKEAERLSMAKAPS